MKVNKHHRKLANNALLPAPKWIPAVISPNYISPTPEDQLKPLPCTVDGSMEGLFSTPTFYKFQSLYPDLGRWRCTRRPSLRGGASRPFCCSWTPNQDQA